MEQQYKRALLVTGRDLKCKKVFWSDLYVDYVQLCQRDLMPAYKRSKTATEFISDEMMEKIKYQLKVREN